jgi:hypothetical protein
MQDERGQKYLINNRALVELLCTGEHIAANYPGSCLAVEAAARLLDMMGED